MNLKSKQLIDSVVGMPAVIIHLIFARVLGFLLRRNHSIEKEPRIILFIKIMGLGSVFLASDAILAIKKKYPGAKLVLVCKDSMEPGLKSLNLFDEFWVVNDNNLLKLIAQSFAIFFKAWGIKRLWVVDLEVYSKLTTIFSLWTFAINRFGFYLNEAAFRMNLNTHNIYFNQFCLVEENYNKLALELGAVVDQRFYFPSFPNRTHNAKSVYEFVAINNTCSELGQERKCPNDLLKGISDWILKNTSYNIAYLGAPSDKDEVECFVQKYYSGEEKRVFNYAGHFSFEKYYRFLYDSCKVVVSIDSAPLHIAKKLGVPTLSIWGPTAPATRIKEDEFNQAVYLAVNCSPCVHFTEELPCGGDNFCMKNIQVQQITDLLNEMKLN